MSENFNQEPFIILKLNNYGKYPYKLRWWFVRMYRCQYWNGRGYLNHNHIEILMYKRFYRGWDSSRRFRKKRHRELKLFT